VESMASSSTITALESVVHTYDAYIDAMVNASATQEELAQIQMAMAQEIGSAITGLNATTIQTGIVSAATNGTSISDAMTATINASLAQTIAGAAAENIMTDYVAGLNQQVGEAITESMTDGSLDTGALMGSVTAILDAFDWDGMSSSVADVTDTINLLIGTEEDLDTTTEDVIDALDVLSQKLALQEDLFSAIGASETVLAMQRTAEMQELRDAAGDASGPLEKMLVAMWNIEDAADAQAAAESRLADAKSNYISAINTEMSRLNSLESDYTSALSSYTSELESTISDLYTQQSELAANVESARTDYMTAISTEISAQTTAAQEMQDLADSWYDIVDDLNDTRMDILTSDASPLALDTQTSEAKTAYDDAYISAMSGDAESAAMLAQLAQAYLDAAQGSMGGLGDYQDVFALVQSQLFSASEIAGAQASEAQASADREQQTIDALTEQLEELEIASDELLSISEAADAYNEAKLAQDASNFEEQIKASEYQLSELQTSVDDLTVASATYFAAKKAFDESGYDQKMIQYQAELDNFTETISLDDARNEYLAAAADADLVAHDQIVGYWQTELGLLETSNSIMEAMRLSIQSVTGGTGYADGGISTGPVSGHLELLHGTEFITPANSIPVVKSGADKEMKAILKELLKEIREDKKINKKVYRVLDRVTGGLNSLQTRAA